MSGESPPKRQHRRTYRGKAPTGPNREAPTELDGVVVDAQPPAGTPDTETVHAALRTSEVVVVDEFAQVPTAVGLNEVQLAAEAELAARAEAFRRNAQRTAEPDVANNRLKLIAEAEPLGMEPQEADAPRPRYPGERPLNMQLPAGSIALSIEMPAESHDPGLADVGSVHPETSEDDLRGRLAQSASDAPTAMGELRRLDPAHEPRSSAPITQADSSSPDDTPDVQTLAAQTDEDTDLLPALSRDRPGWVIPLVVLVLLAALAGGVLFTLNRAKQQMRSSSPAGSSPAVVSPRPDVGSDAADNAKLAPDATPRATSTPDAAPAKPQPDAAPSEARGDATPTAAASNTRPPRARPKRYRKKRRARRARPPRPVKATQPPPAKKLPPKKPRETIDPFAE